MLIGYARVSTDDQNLNLQHDELKNEGCEKIYDDKISGSKIDRPGLASAIEFARQGDVIVVWRLDRLSRSLKDLIEVVASLESKGIGLKSIHESVDTTSSSGKLIFHIFGALAEFERNLIRERTHAGLNAARARGIKGGRPKKLSSDKSKLAIQLYEGKQHTIKQICSLIGVSKPTLYKYLKSEKPI
ncbi:MAG: recombinase family protein [bacterium]|nr:recombinase family protein [bacterium]